MVSVVGPAELNRRGKLGASEGDFGHELQLLQCGSMEDAFRHNDLTGLTGCHEGAMEVLWRCLRPRCLPCWYLQNTLVRTCLQVWIDSRV